MTELHYDVNAPAFPEGSPRRWTKAQRQTAREAADAMGLWFLTTTQVAHMDDQDRRNSAHLMLLMHEHEVAGWMEPDAVRTALQAALTHSDTDAFKPLVQRGFDRLNHPTLDDAAHLMAMFDATRPLEEARQGMIQALNLRGNAFFEPFADRLITRICNGLRPEDYASAMGTQAGGLNPNPHQESLADKLEARRAVQQEATSSIRPATRGPKLG